MFQFQPEFTEQRVGGILKRRTSEYYKSSVLGLKYCGFNLSVPLLRFVVLLTAETRGSGWILVVRDDGDSIRLSPCIMNVL